MQAGFRVSCDCVLSGHTRPRGGSSWGKARYRLRRSTNGATGSNTKLQQSPWVVYEVGESDSVHPALTAKDGKRRSAKGCGSRSACMSSFLCGNRWRLGWCSAGAALLQRHPGQAERRLCPCCRRKQPVTPCEGDKDDGLAHPTFCLHVDPPVESTQRWGRQYEIGGGIVSPTLLHFWRRCKL
jgi:hypothetical protein